MQCPKCQSPFEKIQIKGIEIERCTQCKGLWFDMLEKEDLMTIEGSEVIDVGDEQVGERFDEVRKISCPNCKQTMIPMIDKDQFHIHYESCPTCYGTFFDAGEFRDLKDYSVVERFKQMVDTVRRNLD